MHTRKLCLLLACIVLMLNESTAECSNTTEQSFDVNVSTSESGKVIQSPCSPTPFIAWPESILWRINNHDGCGLALATLHRFRINFLSLELRLVWSPDYDGDTDHAVLSELHRNTGMTMSFENRAIVYIFLDSPIAWLAWFPLDMDPPAIEKIIEEYEDIAFQIKVNSVCENNVTCEDQPCGPGSSCTQLDQGYLCHCAPGYGGINCNDDSRIDQVFLVEEQTAIINSPGYRIKHIDSEQYVWRVTGKPDCGIGILTLDFELADGLLKLRTSPSEYSVLKSFQGNPRPYVYVDYSVIWLEFWSSDRAYVLPEQRGFSLELSIQCYNMSNDVCYRINPCGPRSDCSAFDGGYYCMCDTWYSGVNCLEEQRPVVVMVPDSVDEMVVISPGPIYPPATTFLWRIDADLDCNIGAYFAKLRINYNDVLTILLTPPSLRDIFYQFNQNDFAYFFVESSHLWVEFKSGLGLNRMAELSMLVQCRYDSEVTKCESQGPCYTGSLCTDNPFGYVCMCPPGYTGINCENDTYVTHLHLSKDEDRHLQYSRTDPLTTERNIWHVHGTPHCAVGVSTNRQDFGRITSLRFLRAFNIDTTFALYTRSNLDTWYMYIASSEIVIQIDFKMVFTISAHFELDLESQCTPEVLSCEDSPCSEGSSCLDQDYGFICRCFPGFTGTNCLQGNEVHHIDLEMDRPLVLDLPEYLGYMPPYPQMSWFVQGVEGYTIGVSVQPPSCPFCTSLTMNAEPTQSGFLVESTGSVFVLLNHSSIWLSCPEHTCTIYGAAVHEISIQPSQDLSPDPCEKAECSSSSECHTLDIGGYVCYCWPGFHSVQCKNDSGAHKVFVNSSESVAIPSLSLPMSAPADTTTYVQTIPGCGIGILRIMLQAWPIEYVLLVHSETASDLLRLDSFNSIYDQYHFINHHAIWMEIHSNLKAEFSFVNVTSQCNEGKTASCMPNPCEHGSLCTSLQGDGYSCSCQVGFAGIRCTDELAVGHIEVNASTPGTLQLLAGEFVHPYQAWRVEVTEGCSIGIDFRHLRIRFDERFTIKDNLTAPTINQLYMKDMVKDMYINFPKHVLWFQYEERIPDSTLHIVLYESCVRGNCSLGLCTTDSVCEDFYDGYSCDCIPGFGGVNCAEDVGVRKWILNTSQELDLEMLGENITCKVEVPDQGCGMELFINHSTVVVKGPLYLSLIVQSSVSKSTLLTASEGKFNEYAYFDLSTLWFQLYIPLELTLTSQVRISACCDSFLSELDCSSTPCSVHSDCIDHAAGYKCVCHPGYEGVNCSEVMEKAKGLIEYVHVNNTKMNVTVCVEHQACSNMGCGQQVDAIAASFGCSCDDACEHFGDCCFDYPSTCQNGVGGGNFRVGFGYGGFGISGVFDPFRSEEEEFDMPVSVHPDMFLCVPTVKWNYLFVSRCPPQWNSSHSRARCEGAADFSDPLTFIPVSLGTKVTFRNVYCAVCHGVHPSNLTSWPIDFHCGDDNQRSDLGVMWDRIRRGICNYTIDDAGFPDKPAYRPCSIDMINDCPNDFADSGITEACAEFHAPLKPLDKQSVFSNGYCLECNLPGYSYSPFLPCLAEKLAQNDRPVAGFPLTVLVDFKGNNGIQVKVDEAVVSGKKMECQEGAVFDSLAGICRSLSCTDGYSLHDGECTWSVMCGGNRVGIELSGFDVIDRECVSSQEMHYMIKCLADILELSLDDVSLVHENLEEHHCISHNMNDTISLEVHVKMTYSEIREIMADISSNDLCGALMLQFHVSCSDEEDIPCNNGWLSMDYGSYVSVSYTDQISQLTFRGIQATQRYQPSDIRRMVMIQGQQGNGSLSFLEMIQFCADMTENSTSPGLWDLPCPAITMNASEFRQLIIGNNTFMVHLKSGNQFSESEFTISDTGHILVCSFLLGNSGIVNLTSDWFLQYSDTQSILSTVCVSISLLCLSFTLATHLIFPSLRKLTNNKLLMMLCVFLLVAQLLTVVGSYASPIPLLCKIISVITHFCWIAVFAITNSLAFDLHLTFGYNRSFSFAQTSFNSLVRYIVYIPGVALCVVIPCVCIDSLTDSTVLDYTYGDLCWVGDDFMRFLSFGVPMAVLLAINVILFSYTALGIWKGYQNAKKVGRQNLRPSFQERLDLLKIYIKVSTLMGFTWTTAFIIPFTGITALWYLFIVLNGLQGVYIFLAFTTTARVWNLFKAVVISEPPSLSRKSKGTESTLRSDMSSRSAVDQGKVDDDLTVDLSTIRRWKEEKVESLKKTGGSGM